MLKIIIQNIPVKICKQLSKQKQKHEIHLNFIINSTNFKKPVTLSMLILSPKTSEMVSPSRWY